MVKTQVLFTPLYMNRDLLQKFASTLNYPFLTWYVELGRGYGGAVKGSSLQLGWRGRQCYSIITRRPPSTEIWHPICNKKWKPLTLRPRSSQCILTLSVILRVYRKREQRTLNLTLSEFFFILTLLASFLLAFIRKSLISFISRGIVKLLQESIIT
mgnify:CR=1 FL=1